MPDVKISGLPSGSANASAVVPATNAAGTTTEKITLGAIAALGGGPPASHTHGNVTNAGAIGTTSGLPVKTGTSGVLEAGAFGTGSGQFCQGNDARLSDARTPTSHGSSHHTGGTDALTPANIGAGYAAVASYTTTDQTVASATLTDATNMSFSAAASATYLVTMFFRPYEDTDGDWEAKIVVPSGASTVGTWTEWYFQSTGLYSDAALTTRTMILFDSANTDFFLRRDFLVVTAGTAGTVKLQFAQATAGAGTAAVLKSGSWMVAHRIS